jgi:hypothetical protein
LLPQLGIWNINIRTDSEREEREREREREAGHPINLAEAAKYSVHSPNARL